MRPLVASVFLKIGCLESLAPQEPSTLTHLGLSPQATTEIEAETIVCLFHLSLGYHDPLAAPYRATDTSKVFSSLHRLQIETMSLLLAAFFPSRLENFLRFAGILIPTAISLCKLGR